MGIYLGLEERLAGASEAWWVVVGSTQRVNLWLRSFGRDIDSVNLMGACSCCCCCFCVVVVIVVVVVFVVVVAPLSIYVVYMPGVRFDTRHVLRFAENE